MGKIKNEVAVTVGVEKLRAFAESVLQKIGFSKEEAAIITGSLLESNLRGVGTHGIMRLSNYVERLEKGVVNLNAEMKLDKRTNTTAVLDGDNGQGQLVAMKATREAIAMAKAEGAGFVAVKHSNHFGTAAHYVMKMAEEGLIGMVFSNSSSSMVPFGGAKPFFGTNPLAFGVPAGEERPIVVDMATSVVALGNIILASKEGVDIPEGWAVDKDGNPTTDSKEALNGAILPMSGPKGSGLAVLVDVLSAVLSGASWGPHVNSLTKNFDDPQDVGHFFGAINVEGFMPFEMFAERVDNFIREIKAVPPAPGFSEVFLPGEIEFNKLETGVDKGIPLGQGVLNELIEVGKRYELDFNEYLK